MTNLDLLVISTVHLRDETCAYLASTDCMSWPAVGGPYRHLGFFFHVDETVANDTDHFMDDLGAVFHYAADCGYERVLLYDMGKVSDCLPAYRDPDEEGCNPNLYKGRMEWQCAQRREAAGSSSARTTALDNGVGRLVEQRASLSQLHDDLLALTPRISSTATRPDEEARWHDEARKLNTQLLGMRKLLLEIGDYI